MEKYSSSTGKNPAPQWVSAFRTFYTEFESILVSAYDDELKISSKVHPDPREADCCPRIWKTVGDEVIFCGRIFNIEHAAVIVSAFISALERYAIKIRQDELPLDVKGACWIAAFPAPNVTIEVNRRSRNPAEATAAESDEDAARENRADRSPHEFDFLGKGIDTGFRIARSAAEDKCVVSAQLASLLARAAMKKRFHHSLGYHGRESLKGVVGGIPYPIISVDTERNELNWMLRSREAALRGESETSAFALYDFLETFMQVASIELPCINFRDCGNQEIEYPETYQKYKLKFLENIEVDEKRLRNLEAATDPERPTGDEIEPSQIFLDQVAPATDERDVDPKSDSDCAASGDSGASP